MTTTASGGPDDSRSIDAGASGTGSASRTALVLVHQPSVHLGSFERVLASHGYEIHTLPAERIADAPEDAELVVVLGGDIAVYDAGEFPFIAEELAFLAKRLESEKPTLGICLGAQLMSDALGGRTSKGKSVVIGFREVRLTEAGRDSPLRHFEGLPVMQWHGDGFRLPAGATRLAGSAEYSNEAFRLGDFGLAIQFHPELTGTMFEEWIEEGAAELEREGIDPADLLAQLNRHGADMERAGVAMFDEWLAAL